MEFLIVTGMSGAGKSRAITVLEDMGYYCVDNMPVDMIPMFAELCAATGEKYEKTAMVADIRTFYGNGEDIQGTEKFLETLARMKNNGLKYSIMFLEASDETLVGRYKETRRPHPLGERYTDIMSAVRGERKILEGIREQADYIIDTSSMSSSALRGYMMDLFDRENKKTSMMIRIISFGYKYGVPAESDIVFDVRFLPNPFYISELRNKGGDEPEVWKYLEGFPQTNEFMEKLLAMIDFLIPQYIGEGKNSLVVSFGCTGGQHRSAAVAERLSQHAKSRGWKSVIKHRDMGRNMSEIKERNKIRGSEDV